MDPAPLVCLKGSVFCPPANHTVKKVNFLAFAVEKVKQRWYYEVANQHNTISAGGISTGALLGVCFFQLSKLYHTFHTWSTHYRAIFQLCNIAQKRWDLFVFLR